MLKQTLGWGCAMIALAGLWWTSQLTAQEATLSKTTTSKTTTPALFSTRHVANDAKQQINNVLAQKLRSPLEYDAEKFDLIMASISEEYNIPIVFDRAALDEVAIAPDSEVTVRLRNVTLKSALNIMFKEPGLEDLTYVIDDEVLLITTEETDCEMLTVEVYRVDDLLKGMVHFNSMGQTDAAEKLIDIVTSCVNHDYWMENGTGDGEIHFLPPGMIVVSQTNYVHDELDALFAKLRMVKAHIVGSGKTVAAAPQPVTKGFAINVQFGEKSAESQQRLAEAIVQSVDWDSPQAGEHEPWIEVFPQRVLVHHLPEVVSQVEAVLADMQVLPAGGGSSQGGLGGRSAGGAF